MRQVSLQGRNSIYKHVTHYGPRPGFPYYNLAAPNETVSPIRNQFVLGKLCWSSPGDRSGAQIFFRFLFQ